MLNDKPYLVKWKSSGYCIIFLGPILLSDWRTTIIKLKITSIQQYQLPSSTETKEQNNHQQRQYSPYSHWDTFNIEVTKTTIVTNTQANAVTETMQSGF